MAHAQRQHMTHAGPAREAEMGESWRRLVITPDRRLTGRDAGRYAATAAPGTTTAESPRRREYDRRVAAMATASAQGRVSPLTESPDRSYDFFVHKAPRGESTPIASKGGRRAQTVGISPRRMSKSPSTGLVRITTA